MATLCEFKIDMEDPKAAITDDCFLAVASKRIMYDINETVVLAGTVGTNDDDLAIKSMQLSSTFLESSSKSVSIEIVSKTDLLVAIPAKRNPIRIWGC